MNLFFSKRVASFFSYILVFGYLLVAPSNMWSEEQIRHAFLREYRSSAERLIHDYTNIKIRYRETIYTDDDRVRIRETVGKYNLPNVCLDGGSEILGKKNANKPLRTQRAIECINARYSFTLRPTLEKDYSIFRLDFPEPGKKGFLCFWLAPCAEYLRGQTFLEMAQDPSVSFLDFTDGEWGGRLRKKLTVKFRRWLPNSKNWVELTPNYYFSPEDGWLCHGASYATDKPNVIHEKRYFYSSKTGERYPDLQRIEVWNRDIDNPKNSHRKSLAEVIEFQHVKPIPDAEFTLSAFGLPEPMSVSSVSPSRTWLWLLGATIAAATLALLFAWLKRRHQNAASLSS